MIYKKFKEEKLSLLGFGTMRLPLNEEGTIDEEQVEKMVNYAIEHGVNYFDTAYPYHDGESERLIGRILSKYPRESFYIADKFPGHQIFDDYTPERFFEEQLERCQVEYFDFYLLHNVYEKSIHTYKDSKWKIVDYLLEQKRNGRIKHLGFSTHGSMEVIKEIIDYCQGELEFCLIQLNYLDWTLQGAKEKYKMLESMGIPVWVMEPIRGGKLAKLSTKEEEMLRERRPEESTSAWALRFLQDLPNVHMILSGMSAMEHMIDNVKTFEEYKPLSEEERQLLFDFAEEMKTSVPCTSCQYCVAGCPKGLDIPKLISIYNELKFMPTVNASMRIEAMDADKQPESCISCGKCSRVCPQSIAIPEIMKELPKVMKKLPTWEEVSRLREEAQERNRNK
ncbi:MAG: aldo/keto reductase [Lachnospiraceae bacterium]|nr:aldo/keto reductase [Lachnospiraceae bacterium]